jgi:hypothetical protein
MIQAEHLEPRLPALDHADDPGVEPLSGRCWR